jgi:DNA-binding FadR family transcriptional regulator
VDHVQQQIFSGELIPGDRLPPERQLVQQFGISRTAVREALRSLAAKGLVESQVGRGTFVRRPTTDQLATKFQLVLGNRLRASDLEATFYFALTALAETISVNGGLNAQNEALLREASRTESSLTPAFIEALARVAPNAVLGTMLTVLSRMCEAHGLRPALCEVDPNLLVDLLCEGDFGKVRALLGDALGDDGALASEASADGQVI